MPLNIKLYIAAAFLLLIALLGGGVYYYHSQYVSVSSTNTVLEAKNSELVAQIKADSDAVAKLAADSKAREDAAAAALADAQQLAQSYQKKAQALLLAKAQTPENLCTSADQLFNDYLMGVK